MQTIVNGGSDYEIKIIIGRNLLFFEDGFLRVASNTKGSRMLFTMRTAINAQSDNQFIGP